MMHPLKASTAMLKLGQSNLIVTQFGKLNPEISCMKVDFSLVFDANDSNGN